MVCMGGPAGNWTRKPTMRHSIDTKYTVRYTQYITPWPLTHPCCAPVFFSFFTARDRRQEQRLFRKHNVIWHPSKIFELLLIATLPTFLKLDMLDHCPWNHGPGLEMVHGLGFRYIITSPHNKYWDVTVKVQRLQWVSRILVWGWSWCTNGATACVIWYTLLQKWTPLCVR